VAKYKNMEYLYLDPTRVGLYRLAANMTRDHAQQLSAKWLNDTLGEPLEKTFLKLMVENNWSNDELIERIYPDLNESYCEYLPFVQRQTPPGGEANQVLKRGRCLVISQEKYFQSNMSPEAQVFDDRHGTSNDEDQLEKTWARFGCKVEILRDKTDTELVDEVNKRVASKEYFSGCDYFVLALLGHGDREGAVDRFYGVNGLPVNQEECLLDPFLACPALAGKLKLFVIQACRGIQRHPTVAVRHDGNASSAANSNCTAAVPANVDYIMLFATVKNYAAWRLVSEGTFLVQLLCSELNANWKWKSLLSMLRSVTANVKEITQKQCEAPQVPVLHLALANVKDPFLQEVAQ